MPRLNLRPHTIPANPLDGVLPALYRYIRQQQPIERLDPFWRSLFVQPQRPDREWLQPNPGIISRALRRLKREVRNMYTQFGLPCGLATPRRDLDCDSSYNRLFGHMCPQQCDLAAHPPILRRSYHILGLEFVSFGQKLKDV